MALLHGRYASILQAPNEQLHSIASSGVSSPSLALDAGVVAGVSAARWCLMALVSSFKASSNASNAQVSMLKWMHLVACANGQ